MVVFAVDDTEISIQGRPHTVLAGLVFLDPDRAVQAVVDLKQHYKISGELKWSGMDELDADAKKVVGRDILSIVQLNIGVIVICEGRDKPKCAELLLIRLSEYLSDHAGHVDIVFDDGILPNRISPNVMQLLTAGQRTVSIGSVNSAENELVQLADVYAGFHKIAADIALGRNAPVVELENYEEMTLGEYVYFKLRYSLWDKIDGDFASEDEMFKAMDELRYPFKCARGMGLTIHSTVPDALVDRLYDALGRHWMGCIH